MILFYYLLVCSVIFGFLVWACSDDLTYYEMGKMFLCSYTPIINVIVIIAFIFYAIGDLIDKIRWSNFGQRKVFNKNE